MYPDPFTKLQKVTPKSRGIVMDDNNNRLYVAGNGKLSRHVYTTDQLEFSIDLDYYI